MDNLISLILHSTTMLDCEHKIILGNNICYQIMYGSNRKVVIKDYPMPLYKKYKLVFSAVTPESSNRNVIYNKFQLPHNEKTL